MKRYGLIGFPLSHSFSKGYFNDKFKHEKVDAIYENYEIEDISSVRKLVNNNNLLGLNVTIPFKETVMPYLDELDETALQIGAVNCIQVTKTKILKGYNTDAIGFEKAIITKCDLTQKRALIFGTGGSSKAIQFVLNKHNVPFALVSRKKNDNTIAYSDLNASILKTHTLLINCTPVGMHPNINEVLNIPYEGISNDHFCFDLIYNPTLTHFLKVSKSQGAQIENGLNMLHYQAEAGFSIFERK